jgi:OOP family OmpA-OmpF porin
LDLSSGSAGDTTMSQTVRAASDPNSPLISGGKRLLSGLFGRSEAAVTDAVSTASGLRAGTTSTLLALAAPLVMGFLSKRVRTEGMNMRGLGSLLQRESGAIRNALPAGLADTFWPSVARTTTAPAPVVAQSVEREHLSFRWLPLLALVVLVPAFLWLLNHARRPVAPAVAPITTENRPVAPAITENRPLETANRAETDSVDIGKRALVNDTDLRFDTGSAILRPESAAVLNSIAAILKQYPNVHVKVTGYTDNAGSPDQNLQLSQKRADNIVAQLVRRGIPADRLTAEGRGEEHAIDSTGADQASSRRVTLEVSRP